MGKKLPAGERKYIRKEKARIRSQMTDPAEQERRIKELILRYVQVKKV